MSAAARIAADCCRRLSNKDGNARPHARTNSVSAAASAGSPPAGPASAAEASARAAGTPTASGATTRPLASRTASGATLIVPMARKSRAFPDLPALVIHSQTKFPYSRVTHPNGTTMYRTSPVAYWTPDRHATGHLLQRQTRSATTLPGLSAVDFQRPLNRAAALPHARPPIRVIGDNGRARRGEPLGLLGSQMQSRGPEIVVQLRNCASAENDRCHGRAVIQPRQRHLRH